MDWKGILSLGALALIGGGVAYWVWRSNRNVKLARYINEELTQDKRKAEAKTEKLLADKTAGDMTDEEAYETFVNRGGTGTRD